MLHQFHPSDLAHGTHFRETLRQNNPHIDTTHLDRAHLILSDALARHGDEHLTAKNFAKVMEAAHKDPRWQHTYSSGGALETTLKEHLGIKDAD
ncbi:hypothetical protein COU19_02560 [Candidatus Kaiserbacteria bacterium CG10_big_fil_rev_8_21_14_0_10_56_12]|uniref:Uncharacterized protein n=1 Tax=Candidatus Kaiserbacteria bacterium CG10_big_fil_rev_8_21_14_0_10_56_12 TaxID=1974611 RepID=A0A2H0U9C4_9BACT|nr:MAG: hypothetical protein COU19_02560 [Candidatus Kaiserbacteria bacterium CG10_big_fil_rev_8_21_14_0_10_56_12]